MKRFPNGYGSIREYKDGNRSKPYVAFTPLKRCADGKKRREIIGAAATEDEALQLLAEYNRFKGSKLNYTLEELYAEWNIKAYAKITKSTADCYRAAWKQLHELHPMKVKEIRSGHFQEVIDRMTEEGKSLSSMRNVKVVAGLLETYARKFDVIEKNYADFIELPAEVKKEKEIFTAKQLETLEKAAENGDKIARLIVILCYTGWRIGEFLSLTAQDYDAVNKTFTGGLKTENGKNRVVPVPPHVQPYVDELLNMNGPQLVCREELRGKGEKKRVELVPVTANYFRKYWFSDCLDALGIHQSNGEAYTPHVTRHTFATICRKQGVDPLVTKKLLGHSPAADVTEKTYTHIDMEMLQLAVSQIKKSKIEQK